MNRVSFKNRIALYFSISTALLVFIVFVVIYLTVRTGVYNDLDNDLNTEADNLMLEITVQSDGFSIAEEEWQEKEHNTLDINPIFIQFADTEGHSFVTSPNLKKASLSFQEQNDKSELYFNSSLNGAAIRQYQMPVLYNNKKVGYIIVATPMKDAVQLLQNLRNILIITYPAILLVLFSVARLLAGRSLRPVKDIIDTAGKISRENLGSRIILPDNKDELYTLSETINALLDRIEKAVVREKQFTSDASHELRTPLAVVKGTLEVLVRKPRSREEYEEKIGFCITEVNRINAIVDQLLLLARFESQKQLVKKVPVNINPLLYDAAARHSADIKQKALHILYDADDDIYIDTDEYLFSTILDNLIGNAIKYSQDNTTIKISAVQQPGSTEIIIEDNGSGIPEKDFEKIFNPFYRSKSDAHKEVKGTGIGLSIVKRLCEILAIEIKITSHEGIGTRVRLLYAS